MNLKTPIARISSGLAEHGAVRAWCELTGGAPPATVELWRERSLHNAAIYRLTFADASEAAVFAKHGPVALLAVERGVYQDVLPHLPIATARYRGSHETQDGFLWLFVEDVGEECLSPVHPEHRALAGRWLGRLHSSGAALPEARRLPDSGPSRYLAHLLAGRARIRASLGNRALTTGDRSVLDRVLVTQDALESRWPALERACEDLPRTLVHGDFQPKNLRLCRGPQGPGLYPIDWETAGWGVPAVDLMGLDSPRQGMCVDAEVYLAVVGERWPDLDVDGIRRLSILGRILRTMAAIDWESVNLRFEDSRCLLKPVGCMDLYASWVAQGLEAGAAWLG